MVSLIQILAVPDCGPNYTPTYRLARALRPLAILGIGVGDGRAADMFLSACPTARYVALQRPGEEGDDVAQRLRNEHPEAWIELNVLEGDSARLRRHYSSAFDLVHIVGEDAEDSCLRDLHLAKAVLRTGGHILVDDFGRNEAVRAATARFLHEGGRGFQSLNLPWRGGDLLLSKPRIA
jgi:predicted O-methyltransferase YrrM